jgi:hypothetical protein
MPFTFLVVWVEEIVRGVLGEGEGSRTSRPRVDKHPTQGKLRWEAA